MQESAAGLVQKQHLKGIRKCDGSTWKFGQNHSRFGIPEYIRAVLHSRRRTHLRARFGWMRHFFGSQPGSADPGETPKRRSRQARLLRILGKLLCSLPPHGINPSFRRYIRSWGNFWQMDIVLPSGDGKLMHQGSYLRRVSIRVLRVRVRLLVSGRRVSVS